MSKNALPRKVNVIGHINPDTDSICSAIAYAYLKNHASELNCEPRRAGHISRETEFVLNYLQTEKIPVVAKDLLDSYPRKVYFFPATGRVLVKKLHRVHNQTLFTREQEYRSRLGRAKVEGEIELFT